jgi:hypothetical protein
MTIKLLNFRILYCAILIFFIPLVGKSQNSILSVTPPNDFRFEDLWNLSITTDNQNNYSSYYINLRVFDTNKGLLIEAKSNSFPITTSVTNINVANLSLVTPFSYPYTSSTALNSIIQRGGLFPAGDYKFEYILYGTNAGANTKLAEYSANHSVLMPSFLQLVSVFDKDTVKEPNPNFMWLPASATRTVGTIEGAQEYKLTYTISIAEILVNQTPYVALTSNPQFFYQTGLENTLLTYPFSARRFEPCKSYVWQVKGVINGQTVIASEIWTFSTPCNKEIITPNVPVLVKQKADLAVSNVLNNTVNFAYYEEYHVEEGAILNAVIYNSKHEVVNSAAQLNLQVKKGYNVYKLNTCPSGTNLINGESYLLVITNAKNEKWYLRIVNNQTTNDCY